MVLSKQWFDEEIEKWTMKKDNLENQSEIDLTVGIINGLKIAYEKLVEPLQKVDLKKKDIDVEKGYANIVKYYIDKKGYSVEKANRIAQSTMTDQMQKRLGF